MKKKTTVLLVAAMVFSLHAGAQDGNKSPATKEDKKEITYHSKAEKDKSIAEQEARFKVNQNDPTYPKDDLAKEKQQLEASKKAKIKN